MRVNGKHLDLGLKVFLALLFTIFIFLFKETNEDVKEIRKTTQEHYGQVYDLKLDLEKLKLRVELLKVIPPSDNPRVSMEDLDRIVEMLRIAEGDSR